MFRDLIFVSAALGGSFVVGLPTASLLPRSVASRFMIAPILGFATYAILVTALYVWGVPTAYGAALACASALGAAALSWRLWNSGWHVRTTSGVLILTGLLVLALLTPAWIGGPNFTAFQGNPYDMLNYEGMAYTYGAHPYSLVFNIIPGDVLSRKATFLVDAKIELGIRPAVAIALSSVYSLFYQSTIDAAYPFMVFLSALSFFALTFLLTECLRMRLWFAGIVAWCFVAGFFGQYVMDINAWGQLAGMPLAIAVLAVFVRYISLERLRLRRDDHLGHTAAVAILVGGLLYLYPEITPIYAVAIACAAVVTLALRPNHASVVRLCVMAAGAGVGLVLCLPFVNGTVGSLFKQSGLPAAPVGWANFYSAYLYNVPFGGPLSAMSAHDLLANTAYVLKGLAGAYFIDLKPYSSPLSLAVNLLSVLMFVTLVITSCVAVALLRKRHGMIPIACACVATLALAATLFAVGRPWEAGKGFSMASPLWIAFLTIPLAMPRRFAIVLGWPALLMLVCQIGFAADRFSIAARVNGIGRQAPYPTMASVKRSFLTDAAAWSAALNGCRAVTVSVEDRVIDDMVQIFLSQQALPWSSPDELYGPFGNTRPIGLMSQVTDPNCVMTDRKDWSGPERVISLRRRPSAIGSMVYRGGSVELAVSDNPDVDVSGMYAPEPNPNGFARWTDGAGHVFVNIPQGTAPTNLTMALGTIAPTSDVTVRLNGIVVYQGPQWAGSKQITLPTAMAPGPWTFEIASGTWSAPNDPRVLGVYLTKFSLS